MNKAGKSRLLCSTRMSTNSSIQFTQPLQLDPQNVIHNYPAFYSRRLISRNKHSPVSTYSGYRWSTQRRVDKYSNLSITNHFRHPRRPGSVYVLGILSNSKFFRLLSSRLDFSKQFRRWRGKRGASICPGHAPGDFSTVTNGAGIFLTGAGSLLTNRRNFNT